VRKIRDATFLLSPQLCASKLSTGRAWELKEVFALFWKYKSVTWARAFLDYWCERDALIRIWPDQRQVVDASCGNKQCMARRHSYLRPRAEPPRKYGKIGKRVHG
jgi:hypothetical protein